MTVMLTGTSPNAELYSRALSNAYRWYYRLIDPDWSLEQDPEIWIKKAWRDPVVAQAMQTRMHMVAGREWQIQPGRRNPSPDDTRAADVVADAFARIAKFSEARALLATSVLRGSAYAFTEGTRETVTLAGLRGNWWTPRKLRNISKQRFVYTPETITHEDGRRSIEVQTRFYPLMDPWPVVIPPEFAERLIKVIYLDEEDRLTGIGGRPLLESVFFSFWSRAEIMKTGLQTIEKWAGGLLIGKTDLNANPGELGRDSDSVRNSMLEMLESMRGRHVAVVDKEDEIEHIDSQGGSGAAFLDFLRYMDEKIVGLLLGSVLPFGVQGEASGSYARAVEESETSRLILDYDKQNVSEAISDTVIRLFWKKNRPQLVAAGLGDAAMPKFAILPERRDDFAANAQILSQAINSGMKIKTSEAFEKLGLTQPTQEEIDAGDVIEKEEPAPGGFPFRESPGAKFGAGRPRKFAEDDDRYITIWKRNAPGKEDAGHPPQWVAHRSRTLRNAMQNDYIAGDQAEGDYIEQDETRGMGKRSVQVGWFEKGRDPNKDPIEGGRKVGDRDPQTGDIHPITAPLSKSEAVKEARDSTPGKYQELIKKIESLQDAGIDPSSPPPVGLHPAAIERYGLEDHIAEAPSTSRKRCPDGEHKNPDSGVCEKFAEDDKATNPQSLVYEWGDLLPLLDAYADDPTSDLLDVRAGMRLQSSGLTEISGLSSKTSDLGAQVVKAWRDHPEYKEPGEWEAGQPYAETPGGDDKPPADTDKPDDAGSDEPGESDAGAESPELSEALGKWRELEKRADLASKAVEKLSPFASRPGYSKGFEMFLKREIRWHEKLEEAGEEIENLGGTVPERAIDKLDREAQAEAPSGKRKRCPDGEHKDDEGSCRPVT